MKSIALYARVSSERQAQQATIDSQVAALQQRASADGHRFLPTDLYIDDGYSGTTLVRPALERLRDRIAEGAVDLLYVHSPDRLARRYAYQVLLLEEFSRHGVLVVFLNSPPGRSAEEEMMVQVQGMFAEYERAKLMERYRRGKLHKARSGVVNALSGAPYGYKYICRTEHSPASYQIMLPEARVARQIFDWMVTEQCSIAEICRRLRAQQTPTRTGKQQWDRSTVWALLKNPAYKGQAAYGKTEAAARGSLLRPLRNRPVCSRSLKTSNRDRPVEQWLSIPVPALVSEQVFEAAQQQLARNQRLSQRNQRGQRYLLQGLTVCARCRYAFYGKQVSRAAQKGERRYGYYRCVGSDSYRFEGGRVCTNAQVRVEQLDKYVWEAVCRLLSEPDRVLAEWTQRGDTDAESARWRAQRESAQGLLDGLQKSLQRLLDAYEVGALPLEEMSQRSERLRARLVQAQIQSQEAQTALSKNVELTEVAGRLSGFAAQVEKGLKQADFATQRQIIRALVARVEIDEQGATVVYRVPGSRGGPSSPPAEPTPDPAAPADPDCLLRGRGNFAAAGEHLLERGHGSVVRETGTPTHAWTVPARALRR